MLRSCIVDFNSLDAGDYRIGLEGTVLGTQPGRHGASQWQKDRLLQRLPRKSAESAWCPRLIESDFVYE